MNRIVLLLAMFSLIGCTSFRTTIMQRSSDNRLYPNMPCAKTKGLPVKLKVPTHVEVTVKEAFFIQSTTAESKALSRSSIALHTLADQAIERAQKARTNADAMPGDANLKKAAEDSEKEALDALKNEKSDTDPAAPPRSVTCREIEVYLDGQQVRNFEVETRLIYTDKVFTVDFRRPAGGVLNLSTIDMDDEQYFRQIKAAYEEKTLEQINGAIGAIKSGITGKSATIDGAKVPGLFTDTRTVAVSRFDISNPDWEHELNAFVEKHVTSCYTDCQYRN